MCQIGKNLLCKRVLWLVWLHRSRDCRAAALHIGHMLSRVAMTVGARGILKGRASGVELPRHSREGGHWPCTSRLSGALVLAAVQLESETRPPPPPRRHIHRTEGGWSCSTIWNYVLKGDDSTYLANFRCTRRQLDDLVGQLEAGAPYMVSRLGGRGNPTLFRPRSHGRVLKETEAAKADGW